MSARKYNEQTDRTLPVYDITCCDNLLSPYDEIEVYALHFRSDTGARNWAAEMAKKKDWHSWEIYCGSRRVYFINKNTNEEWTAK